MFTRNGVTYYSKSEVVESLVSSINERQARAKFLKGHKKQANEKALQRDIESLKAVKAAKRTTYPEVITPCDIHIFLSRKGMLAEGA